MLWMPTEMISLCFKLFYDMIRSASDSERTIMINTQEGKFMSRKMMVLLGILAISLCIIVGASAESSGTCGDNLTWTLNDEGVLSISGTGEMTSNPWKWYNGEIKTVVIEKGATTIMDRAFIFHMSLENVTIPDSVTRIGSEAFNRCVSLTRIDLPINVTAIGASVFSSDDALTDVYYGGGEEDRGRIVFGDDNDCLLNASWHYNEVWPTTESIMDIPLSEAVIEELKYKLDNVNFTAKVIGGSGRKIKIPATVKIGKYKYMVVEIGDAAFKGSEVTSVSIGKNVKKIGKKAFYNCKSLTKIIINTTGIGKNGIGKEAFKGTPKTVTVKCPKKRLEEYKHLLIKAGVNKKAKFTK